MFTSLKKRNKLGNYPVNSSTLVKHQSTLPSQSSQQEYQDDVSIQIQTELNLFHLYGFFFLLWYKNCLRHNFVEPFAEEESYYGLHQYMTVNCQRSKRETFSALDKSKDKKLSLCFWRLQQTFNLTMSIFMNYDMTTSVFILCNTKQITLMQI